MAFQSGAIIPTGTTTALTSAVNDQFITPAMKTMFQIQLIQLMVVCASVGIMWYIIKFLWLKFRSVDNIPLNQFDMVEYNRVKNISYESPKK